MKQTKLAIATEIYLDAVNELTSNRPHCAADLCKTALSHLASVKKWTPEASILVDQIAALRIEATCPTP